ncbi:hypothetical protein ACL9RF_03070 [Sphingobacterium sp. Mn56C]|uniref:DoxX family protein n=1 Tax=Sphingobacterium sp. Mn56C TaxID=3395261 RepID=UPI003BC85D0B
MKNKLLAYLKWSATVKTSWIGTVLRILVGLLLLLAGISHLTASSVEFAKLVPAWMPLSHTFIVLFSGLIEILLGLALIALSGKKVLFGWLTAIFLLLVFPANINQYLNHIDAFGLETDQARFMRLFFQPVLILWVLGSTAALKSAIHYKSAR